MNKQDRRFKRTQKSIYEAFANLLLEKDFTEITINDISNLADINRSTFYLHFEDKYALLDAYLLSLLPIVSDIDLIQSLSQQDVFLVSLGKLYDYLQENTIFFKRLFNETNYPFAIRSIRKVLKVFLTENDSVFSEEIGNSKDFTIHIRIAGLIAMIEWFLSQKNYSREQFIEETYDLVSLLEKAGEK
ncbi:TetR/AcrR family transcriptional regulator [Streptococcus orisasini]|uniref:TetR/AcrR family transcriptional regulator n=1 Tax=Streptococcus orisasini TaxID=1080071 RepID=UPI0007090CF5|nr:TetR/AcrR family transcriptional regulator [Streptococcus orisasini]